MGFTAPNINLSQRSAHSPLDFEPPPGKIIQTEEVVVEYEHNYASMPAPLGNVNIPSGPGPLGNIGWAM